MVSAREIAEDVGVESAFVEKEKNRNGMFDYAIASPNDRFVQKRIL